eukprot:7028900-Lingulodinium_polyedra.AAC.1
MTTPLGDANKLEHKTVAPKMRTTRAAADASNAQSAANAKGPAARENDWPTQAPPARTHTHARTLLGSIRPRGP